MLGQVVPQNTVAFGRDAAFLLLPQCLSAARFVVSFREVFGFFWFCSASFPLFLGRVTKLELHVTWQRSPDKHYQGRDRSEALGMSRQQQLQQQQIVNRHMVTTVDLITFQKQLRIQVADIIQQVRTELNETGQWQGRHAEHNKTALRHGTAFARPYRIRDLQELVRQQ